MLNEFIIPVSVLGGIGLIFGIVLAIASKKFAIEEDKTLVSLIECLPGVNCGGCGFSGCETFAQELRKGHVLPNGCSVCSLTQMQKINEILDLQHEEAVRKVARVKCGGGERETKKRFEYKGYEDCRAMADGSGSHKVCQSTCLGLGTCVKACVFDAIRINENGLAEVDTDKCTGCSACVKVCPNHVIELMPADKPYYIQCNSRLKGKAVRDMCTVGCIACGICAKNCPKDAIEMRDQLPLYDYSKCDNAGVCAQKCPMNCISGK